MIYVDDRAGSNELIEPLLALDFPVEVTRLDFGDLAFMGRGVEGAPTFIGIEHKKLPDLVQSLMSDRLAGHQLPGMLGLYDRSYLVIEGEWDVDGAGRVVVPHKFRRASMSPMKGCPPASVLEQRVLTLATRGGLTVRWTRHQRESVRFLAGLYRFWTDHDLDQHKSHLAIHAPDLDPKLKEDVSDFRKGLNGAVPGLGLERTAAIEQVCWSNEKREGSWRSLMLLTEQQLAEVRVGDKQRRLGPSKAAHIMERLR